MQLRENTDAALSPAQLRELVDLLVHKRSELTQAIRELNQRIALKQDCTITDAAEAANLRDEAARAAGIAEQHHRALGDIDLALQRVENGSYGVSEVSGEAIAYERLRLIPWARTAVDD